MLMWSVLLLSLMGYDAIRHAGPVLWQHLGCPLMLAMVLQLPNLTETPLLLSL